MDLLAPLDFAIERLGEPGAIGLAGLLVGVLYGVSAQRSRFCLRAAAVEFARGALGPRVAVWLLAFSTALFWVQLALWLEILDLSEARWRAGVGSLSGALIGGAMFGAGMVLARGCPGRLLVLAASGNLRALLAGLVFAVSAQSMLRGALSPVRDAGATLWTTAGPNPDLLATLGFGPGVGVALGLGAAALALAVAARNRVAPMTLVAGCGVGFAVAAGWWSTESLSGLTFEPTPVESLSFSGPSADLLMTALTPLEGVDFDLGLVPGVFLGAAAAAILFGDWKLEGFSGTGPMLRQLGGAALMGAGAMMAGGCAIGAGLTGGSVFALTAWVALTAFWLGAAATDHLIDRPRGASAKTDLAQSV